MTKEEKLFFEKHLAETAGQTGLYGILESIKEQKSVVDVAKILLTLKVAEIVYKSQEKTDEVRKISSFYESAKNAYSRLLKKSFSK
ncbi:hypothetical protein [Desulfurobacterium sp.]